MKYNSNSKEILASSLKDDRVGEMIAFEINQGEWKNMLRHKQLSLAELKSTFQVTENVKKPIKSKFIKKRKKTHNSMVIGQDYGAEAFHLALPSFMRLSKSKSFAVKRESILQGKFETIAKFDELAAVEKLDLKLLPKKAKKVNFFEGKHRLRTIELVNKIKIDIIMPPHSYIYFKMNCIQLQFPAKFMFFSSHVEVDFYVDYDKKPTLDNYSLHSNGFEIFLNGTPYLTHIKTIYVLVMTDEAINESFGGSFFGTKPQQIELKKLSKSQLKYTPLKEMEIDHMEHYFYLPPKKPKQHKISPVILRQKLNQTIAANYPEYLNSKLSALRTKISSSSKRVLASRAANLEKLSLEKRTSSNRQKTLILEKFTSNCEMLSSKLNLYRKACFRVIFAYFCIFNKIRKIIENNRRTRKRELMMSINERVLMGFVVPVRGGLRNVGIFGNRVIACKV